MVLYISPLDPRFIRAENAARLIAADDEAITFDDAMDAIIRALFSGAFDPEVSAFDPDFDRPSRPLSDWLQIPVPACNGRLTINQAKLDPPPEEYYCADCKGVALGLISLGYAPGSKDLWRDLYDKREFRWGPNEALSTLTRMDYRNHTEEGRNFLTRIYIPRKAMKRWFEQQSLPVPQFLMPEVKAKTKAEPSVPVINGKRIQGRPEKSAWPAVTSTLLKLRKENPLMQKKAMAFEARQRLSATMPENQIPSINTIQRRMGAIFREHDR